MLLTTTTVATPLAAAAASTCGLQSTAGQQTHAYGEEGYKSCCKLAGT
eukprot:CAMPEP_0177403534 /NCGR_PEP_ID=MMETSP0368-20130122/60899_1 /TAXON_ID=447022 ORGANISM="Scrippsiella hangoei-like, Strain SHHI-4" /NCGR_SAMPLE_ID=MMETSP0368 /ASSEMBLY_ACC=CAM_ASM_000363 /LENGTH=47 /DNA_ID= /DNA_START= /DNA_END= /DNA_ORIENTATION=